MEREFFKSRIKKVVEQAKEDDKIKTYSDFCKTEEAEKYKLSEEEVQYYTSKNKRRPK